MKNNNVVMNRKNISYVLIGTAFILLIPLASMRFSSEFNWGFFDFVAMGILLSGTSLLFLYLADKVKSNKSKALLGLALFLLLGAVWVELAVGIFD